MTKTELHLVLNLQREIERQRTRLEALRLSATNITKLFDGLSEQGHTLRTDLTATLIAEAKEKIADLQRELDTKAIVHLTNELTSMLSDDRLVLSVMIQRYCGGLKFAAIASNLHYSHAYITLLHKRGIKRLNLSAAK